MAKNILLVEDEASLRMTLSDRLAAEGYEIEEVDNGNDALSRAGSGLFDLIILDVMLPGKSGFDVCRDLRQMSVQTPILMLTARREVVDRVVGLKLGADDYLTKPFDMMELTARVEALLRRAETPVASSAGTYTFGHIRVDFGRSEVRSNGEEGCSFRPGLQIIEIFHRKPRCHPKPRSSFG